MEIGGKVIPSLANLYMFYPIGLVLGKPIYPIQKNGVFIDADTKAWLDAILMILELDNVLGYILKILLDISYSSKSDWARFHIFF
ncbi:hypothetical protein SAMN04489864_104245 [Pedobacter insulae]|uniref:Uncharacterized protein n=1 Tax=Pedobacter insulae TaxID=414048 RepID=A0A1I2WTZ6_9SPHI|nr:hypothetical protein SAMN04489864_104245 [Pedobacter insulae]